MRKKAIAIIAAVGFVWLMGFAAPLMAETINVLGIEILGDNPNYPNDPYNPGNAYRTVKYGMPDADILFTEVTTDDFAYVNLDDYDVLIVSHAFLDGGVRMPANYTLDALFDREADIAAWLRKGHGIVAMSEPIGTNPYEWLPNEVQPDIIPKLHVGVDAVFIHDTFHPVMDGLTSDGLSGWRTSSHNHFQTAGGLDVLVIDSGGHYITLAGAYDFGKLVLTTQDPDWHYYNATGKQTAAFVQNAIEWVAEPATAVVSIDIDPDTLNLKSKGKWVTAYIELPEGFSPNDIDIDSILLSTITADLAVSGPNEVGDYDGDGVSDLMVKFDRKNLMEFPDIGDSELILTGELTNGLSFEGTDTIRVIKKGK